jgi:hypothetical protein
MNLSDFSHAYVKSNSVRKIVRKFRANKKVKYPIMGLNFLEKEEI